MVVADRGVSCTCKYLSPIDATLPPLPKFVTCLQFGLTKFTNCSPSARIESSLELKLRALLPTTGLLMFRRLVMLLTPLLPAAEVSFRVLRNESSAEPYTWKRYVTFLCLSPLLAFITSCYTCIPRRPTPLCSKSSLSQSICTPTGQLAALLWVNEGLYLTNLELSVFLNNGEDPQAILVELVKIGRASCRERV